MLMKTRSRTCLGNGAVVLIAAGAVASGSFQVVAFKRAGYSLGPYPYFILLAVGGAFVPILALAALASWAVPPKGLSKETTSCAAMRAYGVIGALNGVNGLLTIFSVPFVAGVEQAILAQLVIPITLLLSRLVLGTRFGWLQLLGAAVILFGVAIEVVPPLVALIRMGSAGGDAGGVSAWWLLVFAAGQVPQGLNGVYQELAFGGGGAQCCARRCADCARRRQAEAGCDAVAGEGRRALLRGAGEAAEEAAADAAPSGGINVTYMMMWAAVAQMALLCAAAPLNWIPALSAGGGWSGGGGSSALGGAGAYFADATRCLARRLDARSAECDSAAFDLGACVATMLLTTVLQALLVKRASAVLAVLVITMTTPVSALLFTSPLLMGAAHVESFHALSAVAFGVLIVGLAIYRAADVCAVAALRRGVAPTGGERRVDAATLRERDQRAAAAAAEEGGEGGERRPPPAAPARPILMATRSGIIVSEFTNGGGFAETGARARSWSSESLGRRNAGMLQAALLG